MIATPPLPLPPLPPLGILIRAFGLPLSSASLCEPNMPSIPPPRLLNAVTPATSRSRRKLSRMSPLRMWLYSCATTPCSSSLSRNLSAPAVTQREAASQVVPATNALTSPESSSTHTDGMGTPDAMDISSQTLKSLRRASDFASLPFVRERTTCFAPMRAISFSGDERSSLFTRKPTKTTRNETRSEYPTTAGLSTNGQNARSFSSMRKRKSVHAPHAKTNAAAATTAATARTASATSRPVFRRASSWSANGSIRT